MYFEGLASIVVGGGAIVFPNRFSRWVDLCQTRPTALEKDVSVREVGDVVES